jgi:hypothetical protein
MGLFFGQKQPLIKGIVCKLLSLCGLDDMKEQAPRRAGGKWHVKPCLPAGLTREIELTAEYEYAERNHDMHFYWQRPGLMAT